MPLLPLRVIFVVLTGLLSDRVQMTGLFIDPASNLPGQGITGAGRGESVGAGTGTCYD